MTLQNSTFQAPPWPVVYRLSRAQRSLTERAAHYLLLINQLLPELLTCEIRQGLVIHQEQGPHLLLLQEVPGCSQGGEDLVLGDVEAQPRQPLQQVPLALLGGVGDKPHGHRGTAQPGGGQRGKLGTGCSCSHISAALWG